ncbi:30S ribosome-binding factor RbfA [Flexithrix dorotheae]|uniref:30S ribosome-binding factor RbfA n=1 Tax=Flexithrix dorotheae TaxID=70993 RepID=UPI0003644328|nr:30S ribosome-binding factor RbfA [Flexithrix dorotheae]
MESKRQKKYSSLFQKDLGEIFQQLSKDHFKGAFITVTSVKVTPDLGMAKVYLSFLLVKDKEDLLLDIQNSTKLIRQKLGTKIKNQVRKVPELLFFYDDTQEVASKVDQLFENLNIPPEDDNDDYLKDYKEE